MTVNWDKIKMVTIGINLNQMAEVFVFMPL